MIKQLIMSNQPSVSIRGRMKPLIKTEIQKNYNNLIRNRNLLTLKLKKQLKPDLEIYNTSAKKLISKSEIKLYHQIKSKHKLASEKEKLKFIGTRQDLQDIINKHRKAFNREILKVLPQIKELRKNNHQLTSKISSYIQEIRSETGNALNTQFEIGDLSILEGDFPTDPTLVNFSPPYPLMENYHEVVYDYFKSLEVDSRVDEAAGLLIHEITSDHEDNGWFTHNASLYDAYVSVGVNYTLPRTGTLQVDLFIQNLVNESFLNLVDNFGASEGRAFLTNSLFLQIVHPNNIIPFEIEMNNIELSSDGDTIYQNDINTIDTEFSKWLNFRSTGSFVEGTNVQIYVGNKDRKYSIMDDMDCKSSTLFSWFVRNIVVRTV